MTLESVSFIPWVPQTNGEYSSVVHTFRLEIWVESCSRDYVLLEHVSTNVIRFPLVSFSPPKWPRLSEHSEPYLIMAKWNPTNIAVLGETTG